VTLIPCTTAIALHNSSSSATAEGPRTNVTPQERAAILECRSIVLQSRVKLNLFHISLISSKGIRNFAVIITLCSITEFHYFFRLVFLHIFVVEDYCSYILAVHLGVMILSANCHLRNNFNISEKDVWLPHKTDFCKKCNILYKTSFLYYAIFIFGIYGSILALLPVTQTR
jgi:hypothetical protein